MSDRHAQSCAFLDGTEWQTAQRRSLAGDASNRRYERLTRDDGMNGVLMDAPPDKGEDVRPFVRIARHLCDLGLSAPRIYEADPDHGFLLIEDLGDALFARVLQHTPELEAELYQAAAAALIVAQAAKTPALEPYGVAAMTETALLLPDWYLAHGSEVVLSGDQRAEFATLMKDLLSQNLVGNGVLAQRDYHAENLLWLPQRDDVARVGLLDFQDAMLGHPAYDLASLLKDARRDVSEEVQQRTFDFYLAETGADRDTFTAAYAACSAQRNIRILGVFARLCVRDGKSGYPDLMPRVWRNLQDDLTHPALSSLRSWINKHVPPPSVDLIARIKAANNG